MRLLLLSLLLACAPAYAMEKPSAAALAAYRADGTLAARAAFAAGIGNNRLRAGAGLGRSGARASAAALPPAWRGMPTTGSPKIFVLLLDFSDYAHAAVNTQPSVDSKIFGAGAGQYPYESVKNFYSRSSYTQLNLQGSTLGWYRAAAPRSAVPETAAGRDGLIMEALNNFNGGHDFAQYDNDGDGVIDYFAVIWTGPDNGWGNFWWSYQVGFSSPTYTVDGKRLGGYAWQWESNPSGNTFWPRTLIHETGHALGLPDYYDYDAAVGPDGGVGGLDMMDSSTGDHNAFSKYILGWLSPAVVASGGASPSLRPSDANGDAVKLMPGAGASPFEEYFLVQNRRISGNDSDLPGSGLLIWHVDARLDPSGQDYLYDNSYTSRKLLRLMEADGLEEIEAGLLADAADYYGPLSRFGPATAPNSARYGGAPTGVFVENIGTGENPRTFDCGTKGAAGSVTVADSLFRPLAGGRCRLDVATAFAGQLTVKAYTSNGEFLKTVYSGPAASGVSSYSWGGETESGAVAASGMYLLKVKGPGVDSIKKVVLLK